MYRKPVIPVQPPVMAGVDQLPVKKKPDPKAEEVAEHAADMQRFHKAVQENDFETVKRLGKKLDMLDDVNQGDE